jgi:hypothetical protein
VSFVVSVVMCAVFCLMWCIILCDVCYFYVVCYCSTLPPGRNPFAVKIIIIIIIIIIINFWINVASTLKPRTNTTQIKSPHDKYRVNSKEKKTQSERHIQKYKGKEM